MICAEHMQIVTLWSFSSTSAERKVVLRCLEYLCHLSMKAIGPEVRAEAAGWSWKASEAGRSSLGLERLLPVTVVPGWYVEPRYLSCTPPTKFNIQIRVCPTQSLESIVVVPSFFFCSPQPFSCTSVDRGSPPLNNQFSDDKSSFQHFSNIIYMYIYFDM